jgi:hypothetical protein
MEEINKPPLTPEAARQILWFKGNITFLFDVNQAVLYKTYKDSDEKVVVWNCSRGLGKSYALCVIAIQECLSNPKALVKYCCPKQKDARQIIQPLIRDIIESCPLELRPRFNVAEGAYKFSNGAQIQLSGLDNGRAESLRGGSSVLCIVDEAGSKSLKDLEYIVQSILLPAVTRTRKINGKIILASTPPVSEAHPFVKFLRIAELSGSLVTRDIYTNPRMTERMIEDIIKSCRGKDTTAFKREYLCQIITEEDSAVIPEFNEDLRNRIIKEWKRPPFFDYYTAMDIGFKDMTVVLFAYFDFKHNKLIIEDEFVTNGKKATTAALAAGIKQKEAEHFADAFTGELRPAYKRVSDNNLIVINDLWELHGLSFIPTKKDDAEAALNNLRMMLANEQIIINPRCITLIRHLKDATWNKNRTSYDRSADNGHFDAVDSAKYLVRNVDFFKNPYPSGYGAASRENMFQYRNKKASGNETAIKQIMNFKKK